jgi:GAF domain-containing protein
MAEQARRRAVLNQTSEQLNRAETLDDIFNIIAENTTHILPSDRVTLAVLTEDGDYFSVMSLAGVEGDVPVRVNQPLAGSFIEKAIQTGDILVTHDLQPNSETGIRSSMIVPLVTSSGTMGTLNVGSKAVDVYGDLDQGLILQIASILSSVIENKRLLTETQVRAKELALINQVVADVSASLDIKQSLQVVADELAKAIGVDAIGIALMNQDKASLTVAAEFYDPEKSGSSLGFVIPIEGNALTQEVLKTRQTVLVEDAQNHPLTAPVHEGMRMRGVNTLYVIPMFAGKEIVGTVGIDILEKERRLQPRQLRLAETLIFQAAAAVQNARLFAQAEERAQQLAVLNEVAHVVSQQLDLKQLFTAVHEQIQRVIFSDAFFVAIHDPEKQLIHLPYTFDNGQYYEEEPFFADPAIEVVQVIQTGEPLLANYTPEEHAREQEINETLMATMKAPTAMLFVPLRSGSKVIGAISVQNYQFHSYTESDQNLLLGIANHVAVALENVRLFSESQQRAAELSLINAVSELASSQLDLSSLFASVGELLQGTFSAESFYFALYDKSAKTINFPYFFSREDGLLDVAPRSFDEGYTGQIIAARKSILRVLETETAAEQMQAEGAQIIGSGRDTDCYLGTPMIVGSEVIGVVGLSSYREVRTYNEQDQRLLETLADTIGVAVQNVRQFQAAQRRAEREALINSISQKIQSAPTVRSALETAVSELGQALKLKKAVVELTAAKQSNGQSQD